MCFCTAAVYGANSYGFTLSFLIVYLILTILILIFALIGLMIAVCKLVGSRNRKVDTKKESYTDVGLVKKQVN